MNIETNMERHYPFTLFVAIVNSNVIASPSFPSYPIIYSMMTHLEGKIGICSKACGKTLSRRGHMGDVTKQRESNKL